MTEMMTEEAQLVDLFPYEESKDSDRRTHVVRAGDNPHIGELSWTGQDVVDAARIAGLEVKALCGYVWVPKHNPEKFDACKTCLDIWSKMGA